MRIPIKAWALVLVLSLRLVAPMAAGPIEDTAEAVRRGDYASALRVWRPLADQGNATAQALLANSYLSGLGVEQDYAEAAKWLRKAADQGYAQAQFGLELMYANGDGGLPQDNAEAVAWYRKAADQGLASAQGSLGQMYANGQGVPQDYAIATMWYRKSAEQGDAVAQNNLGLCTLGARAFRGTTCRRTSGSVLLPSASGKPIDARVRSRTATLPPLE